jgi:transposase
MPHEKRILGLPGFDIKEVRGSRRMDIQARYTGPVCCPECGGQRLRNKGKFTRTVRHENSGVRMCMLHLETGRFHCSDCGRYFNQRFPGIKPWKRSTEAFRRQIFRDHHHGICQKTLAKREKIGTATVERWYHDFLKLKASEMRSEPCPEELGIDEHFFTRKKGFATTLCDLKHHKVYDVVLGRSEASLEGFFQRLKGKQNVKLVCIDLASNYRSLVRKHFPNAKIVADRFHVVRIVNHHFMAAWRELDPVSSKNRGLISLMRRHPEKLKPEQQLRLKAYFKEHPEVGAVYEFKQRLMKLLRKKTCTARRCKRLIPKLLDYIHQLRTCGIDQLQRLGRTLGSWSGEIAAMWRFTKNNGITEGFHNKMEMISRRAFGFRNFENYRLRVRVLCA